nr:hypothetical protein CKG001_10320 [Bdellovibrio sp. CKG001]
MRKAFLIIMTALTFTACSKSGDGVGRSSDVITYLASEEISPAMKKYYVLKMNPAGRFEYFSFQITNSGGMTTLDELHSSCHPYTTPGTDIAEFVAESSGGDLYAYPFTDSGLLADKSILPEISPLAGSVLFTGVTANALDAILSSIDVVNSTVARCSP